MIPFDKTWFRNKWFVTLLIIIAINLWSDALKEIKEIQFRSKVKNNINNLVEICNSIKK